MMSSNLEALRNLTIATLLEAEHQRRSQSHRALLTGEPSHHFGYQLIQILVLRLFELELSVADGVQRLVLRIRSAGRS